MYTRWSFRILTVLALIVVLSLLISACGGEQSAAPTAPEGSLQSTAVQAEGEKEPYRIGVINSLTGTYAAGGESMKAGYMAALKLFSDQGGIDGRPVEIIEVDDESNPEISSRAVERLAEQGVPLIVGPAYTPTSYAAEAAAQRLQVPMISMSGAYKPSDGNKWAWAPSPHMDAALAKYTEYSRDKGLTAIATLSSTDALGDVGEEEFNELFAGNPDLKRVAQERVNIQGIEFTPQLMKVKASNPDIVYTYISGTALYQIRKQMDQVGLENTPMIIAMGNVTNESKRVMSEYRPGSVLYVSGKVVVADLLPDSDPLKGINVRVTESIKAGSGRDPEGTSLYGYDPMLVALEALKGAGPDRQAIKSWLENNAKGIVGLAGKYNLSKDDRIGLHDPESMTVIYIDENQNWAIAE
ncbi:MAG: amino acid ABC transporter substrate-binding protein [Clostridia bacterium]|nr:MAG: amino acid ABC transporter substrate-binding protein [Clostridia bacterium]